MYPDFASDHTGIFQLSPILPQGYRGVVLNNAAITTAENDYARLVFQEFIDPGFTIYFQHFRFLKDIQVKFRQQAVKLVSLLAINNTIRYSVEGLGALTLEPGQLATFHTKQAAVTGSFSAGKTYESFAIAWTPQWPEPTLPYFEKVKKLFSPKTADHSFFLNPPGSNAGFKMLDVVHELLHTDYTNYTARYYYDLKVREYMLLLLSGPEQIAAKTNILSREEEEKIIALGAAISQAYNKKFPIVPLARQLQMNETKLKDGFSDIFGMGIFSYHLSARMNEAHRLLLETDLNTKQIALKVGYKLTTSFIDQFRKFFGYTPGTLSRNRKK